MASLYVYGMTLPCCCSTVVCGQSASSKGYVQKRTTKANIHHCKTPLDHMIIMCTLLSDHIPSFGVFNFDIAPVMLYMKMVWLTCEHGTEMGTPLPVLNKHRKLSPISGKGRPELIVRIIWVWVMKTSIPVRGGGGGGGGGVPSRS